MTPIASCVCLGDLWQRARARTRPGTGGRQPANYEQGGYIEKVPLDPWGTPYFYQSDGNAYVLKSYGADGKPGGSGKDEDIAGSSS